MKTIIQANKIIKTFKNGEIETPVLRGVDLSVREGEFLSIMGRSGAGKSTLMYQLSLLDDPTSGNLNIDGVDVLKLSNKQKTNFRLEYLGYVFQDYALVPELTAVENVSLPLLMRGVEPKEAFKKSEEILNELDLRHHSSNLPSQLSGGEQQRVSIARAIVDEPKIIFSDEPTANLDSVSARIVIDILKKLNKKGQTIIMVTHEEEYGAETDRIIRLSEGLIEKEEILNKSKFV
ncbi:MAG TPA: ABC transporter ATP-binding protein [Candidatus Paceibacterota bacterium]|nr:ABC transporter ATP-binding protein [Candidatus Paceibacterota bacterium]HMP18897.1 ABC transporter ATP-binding protein [Candidatus Paceibacterota bacterium]HMP85058.1 ABC transporter ATP-binding protein [Candidatus Paceibacterota bacterium]